MRLHLKQNELLKNVINEYNRIYQGKKISWKNMDEDDLWYELCLCVLSSNVQFETAKSAFDHLKKKRLLERNHLFFNKEASRIISKELSRPIFLPRRKDGTLRKYRFFVTKSNQITKAFRIIYEEECSIKSILTRFASEYDARDFLANRISGLGLKQSSLFLRNIGYASHLAIIDTHVINFMVEVELFRSRLVPPISARQYRNAERKLQAFAKKIKTDLSLLDFAIWTIMRENNRGE